MAVIIDIVGRFDHNRSGSSLLAKFRKIQEADAVYYSAAQISLGQFDVANLSAEDEFHHQARSVVSCRLYNRKYYSPRSVEEINMLREQAISAHGTYTIFQESFGHRELGSCNSGHTKLMLRPGFTTVKEVCGNDLPFIPSLYMEQYDIDFSDLDVVHNWPSPVAGSTAVHEDDNLEGMIWPGDKPRDSGENYTL